MLRRYPPGNESISHTFIGTFEIDDFPSQPLGSQSPAMFFHSDGRDQHQVATDRLGKVPRGSKGGIPSPSPIVQASGCCRSKGMHSVKFTSIHEKTNSRVAFLICTPRMTKRFWWDMFLSFPGRDILASNRG